MTHFLIHPSPSASPSSSLSPTPAHIIWHFAFSSHVLLDKMLYQNLLITVREKLQGLITVREKLQCTIIDLIRGKLWCFLCYERKNIFISLQPSPRIRYSCKLSCVLRSIDFYVELWWNYQKQKYKLGIDNLTLCLLMLDFHFLILDFTSFSSPALGNCCIIIWLSSSTVIVVINIL